VSVPDPDIRLAYARLFSDNPAQGDGKAVLADMANAAGLASARSIAGWAGHPDAFGIICHEENGRRYMFERAARFAGLTETEMLELHMLIRQRSALTMQTED
jgi:hypothetical protein